MTWIALFIAAAILCAGASYWLLAAYRRAGGKNRARALGLCVTVCALALGAYAITGSPSLADSSHAARVAEIQSRELSTYTIEEALVVLAQGAREHPRDPAPHFFTGQLLLDAGRPEEAARAYDAALRRAPDMVEAKLGLARALVQVDDGRVSDAALALFEEVGRVSNDPTPWLYQAMAAMQSGREVDAQQFWNEAGRRMAPDDPRREMARRMSAGAP